MNAAPEFWSVSDIVGRVTAGEISASALVEPAIERVASFDGQLGAFLVLDATGARATAAELDRRGKTELVAHGFPRAYHFP